MKINIKEQLLQEDVVQHLKDNWGKYALGAGVVGTGLLVNNGTIPTTIEHPSIRPQ